MTYILGYFINNNGAIYATVYSNITPPHIRSKIEYDKDNRDIFDQVYFCSPDYFKRCINAGYAIKYNQYEEYTSAKVSAQEGQDEI